MIFFIWATLLLGIITAFFSGLQPKRNAMLALRAVSGLNIIAFAILLYRTDLNFFFVGRLALATFFSMASFYKGTSLICDSNKIVDYNISSKQFETIIAIFVAGAVAFWGYAIAFIATLISHWPS